MNRDLGKSPSKTLFFCRRDSEDVGSPRIVAISYNSDNTKKLCPAKETYTCEKRPTQKPNRWQTCCSFAKQI